MCDMVIKNEKEFATVQDFVNEFGEVIKKEHCLNLDLSGCLCQIDIPETLNKLKIKWDYDGISFKVNSA